jgi:DNA-directed RNA polymerase subunit RPC12/RpoP
MTTCKKLFCLFCGYELEQTVAGYECLRCGAEVLPGDQTKDPFADWLECYREDVKRQSTKRTGNRKGGRRFDTKKVVKPLPSEWYKLE